MESTMDAQEAPARRRPSAAAAAPAQAAPAGARLPAAPADVPEPLALQGGARLATLFGLAGSLLLALVVDRVLLTPFPIAWIYGLPVLVAAYTLPPRPVALIGAVAVAAQLIGVHVAAVPAAVWPFYTSGVVLMVGVSVLLAHGRELLRRRAAELRHEMSQRRAAEDARERLLADEQAARAVADAERRRWRLLAEAMQTFAASGLALPALMETVARRIAEAVGDACLIRLLSEDGAWLVPVAVYHADPQRLALAREVASDRVAVDEGLNGRVMGTGQSLLLPSVSPEEVVSGRTDYTPLAQRLAALSILVVPLRGRDGLLGTLSVARDSTERPLTGDDRDLVQALADRAALVVEQARLYEAERSARAAAEAALQARDRVLAAVSHDLKNPLAAIGGYAQLLGRQMSRLEAVDPAASSSIAASTKQIQASVQRMVRWIGELTDVSLLQAGQHVQLARGDTDLVALAEQVAAELRPGLTKHHIDVRADESALIGNWDRARLERVLHNLVGNAVKYSPRGGQVEVQVAREMDGAGSCAVIRVRDQGVGIPEADLPHVFEPFRRGRNVTGIISGTGIGLATARGIVAEHGGSIAVESRCVDGPDSGTVFTVRLPLAPVTTVA